MKHCSKKCGWVTIASKNRKDFSIGKTCEYCEETFYRRDPNKGQSREAIKGFKKRRFCSKECYYLSVDTKQADGKFLCSKCKVEKERNEFTPSSTRRNGITSQCRKCSSDKYHSYSSERRAEIRLSRVLNMPRESLPLDLVNAQMMYSKIRNETRKTKDGLMSFKLKE